MSAQVTDFFLYKWRYPLGCLFAAVVVGVLLFYAVSFAPGELRQAEIDAAIHSSSLSLQNLTPSMVVDLPYHALQRAIFWVFGISTLSIKLPSIVLAALTVLGLGLLIRTWFRRNIAIIAVVLATVSTQFLFMAQDGTPLIMHSFLSVWLLFFATYVTRQKLFGTLWKVLSCVLLALSLYTPFGLYLALAVVTTTLFHPHVRYIVKRFSTTKLLLAVSIGIVATLPIVYASLVDRSVAFQLLGIPENLSSIPANVHKTLLDLFGFFAPSTDAIVRPLYPLGMAVLLALGLFRLFTYKYTARSYIMVTWGIFIVPLVLISEGRGTYLFPLGVLLTAMGIAMLVTEWYRLFPRNPYARVTGLIPLSIVVIGLVSSGAIRYVSNYQYNPAILRHYTSDVSLLREQLAGTPANSPTYVIVTPDELPFYTLINNHDDRFKLATETPTVSTEKIYTRASKQALNPEGEPSLIITNARSETSDRFYIYKSAAK